MPLDYVKEMRYDKWGRLRQHVFKPRTKLKRDKWITTRSWEICNCTSCPNEEVAAYEQSSMRLCALYELGTKYNKEMPSWRIFDKDRTEVLEKEIKMTKKRMFLLGDDKETSSYNIRRDYSKEMRYNKFGTLCEHVYKPSAKLKGGKWIITHSWEICIKPRDYSKEMRYDKWGRLRKHIYKPRAKLKGGEWIMFRDWEICAPK